MMLKKARDPQCVLQGRLLNLVMIKAEFCYAPPNISPLYVSKTAQYSTGMQPGTAAWNFFKSVALAPPFSNNIASMFRGDSAVSAQGLTELSSVNDTVLSTATPAVTCSSLSMHCEQQLQEQMLVSGQASLFCCDEVHALGFTSWRQAAWYM